MDSFTVTATKCARRMATFVKILNKEDISTIEDRESIREVETFCFDLTPSFSRCLLTEKAQ